MENKDRQMWQFPWGYRESFVIVLGLFIIGVLLQLSLGNFDFLFLAYPINMYCGIFMVLSLLLLLKIRNTSFYKWLSGVPLAVSLLAMMLFLTMIMGLTPQLAPQSSGDAGWLSRLGFSQMTSSWPFVLLYLFLLYALGALIIRRLLRFRKADAAFYFTHIGLWVLLFAAGLGASDIKRYVMYVNEGQVEWRAYNKEQELEELPIAIQLNDFILEEYPPKLAIIKLETGAVQPENRPDLFQIDEKRTRASLWNYELEVVDYIHEAMRNSDSTYTELKMPGSCPAAQVILRNGDQTQKAWVSSGNQAQLYMTMPIDDTYALVMTQPEPKRFISDIEVFTPDEKRVHTRLEVNKPLRVGRWTVYQYGYDNQAGKMSSYSSFELVYDPWLSWVYVGIFILALGCVILLWTGSKKKGGLR